jgi:hypothetical protein
MHLIAMLLSNVISLRSIGTGAGIDCTWSFFDALGAPGVDDADEIISLLTHTMKSCSRCERFLHGKLLQMVAMPAALALAL